ncbi:MAG: Sua5/YciO/YrdC/YwlC family protein [Cardiobacteriaceae bacterium]|nr:Sua5/YciO/YrdC/YwlC family protein [Cardiobacteriaceae bacterium]
MIIPFEKHFFLDLLHNQKVFAYPTEAVFGLGGSPFSHHVYEEILRLKGARRPEQGLLLVAASWTQCTDWVVDLDSNMIKHLQRWAETRPTTFILPATHLVPDYLRDTATKRIAIRVSTHPLVKQLCEWANSPLISTSANPSGKSPARSLTEIQHYFPDLPIMAGELGNESRPSRLLDVANATIIRD